MRTSSRYSRAPLVGMVLYSVIVRGFSIVLILTKDLRILALTTLEKCQDFYLKVTTVKNLVTLNKTSFFVRKQL